jgi:probable HAF family extracellular repeat protein
MIFANSKRFRSTFALRASADKRLSRAAIAAAAIFTAFVVASAVPAWAASSKAPAASTAADSAPDQSAASRKNKNDVGIRGHGFVRDGDVFSTIDAPGAGLYTVAFGIDESGKTVGGYVDERGKLHGFLKDKEAFSVIDYPGAAATFVSRINARGQIVGAYGDDSNVPALELPHGFLFDNSAFTKIDVPGALRTQPFGINNLGQIVGEYQDGAGTTHGFLLDQGIFTTIDVPGATATLAYDIEDSGRIVGFSRDATGTHGFLRDAQGAFTTIDAPGADVTVPLGINNRGQIAGASSGLVDAQRVPTAFVLENGAFTTIDVPDATPFTTVLVSDINDQGQLAGAYDIVQHGFLRDRRGKFTTIDPPQGNINEQLGINHRGQIVGRYGDANFRQRGFLQDK